LTDPSILDKHAANFAKPGKDSKVKFKCSARRFVKLYNFLGAMLPYANAEWERLCIFLTLLLPKLPAVRDDEFPSGLYEAVDLESCRIEAKETLSIILKESELMKPDLVTPPAHTQEPPMSRKRGYIEEVLSRAVNVVSAASGSSL